MLHQSVHIEGGSQCPPYTLTVKDAAQHFGFHPHTLYGMIATGKLHLNYHYLKVGKKVLIIRDKFIEWLHQESEGVSQS